MATLILAAIGMLALLALSIAVLAPNPDQRRIDRNRTRTDADRARVNDRLARRRGAKCPVTTVHVQAALDYDFSQMTSLTSS